MLEKIGTGSYATVYRARDRELGREVAVKQIHQQYMDDPQQLDRYWQEAQLLASLHHPNIVTIFDVFRERGWLILELMQANLGDRLAGRQMDLRALRATLAHALRALSYLHSRGIVHGDIKPSNLMLDARRRVKIGDFGLARRVSDEEGSLLKGTTKYMAPEVVSDEFGEVGPASDLYSLGFTAYDLMCGPNFESLFPGLSAFGRNKQVAWMMWHAAADRRLPEIRRVLQGVPDDLAHVIQKLCEKDQAKRYRSADEALADLNVDVKPAKGGDGNLDELEHQAAAGPDRKRTLLLAAAVAVSVLLSLAMLFFPTGGGQNIAGGEKLKRGIVRDQIAAGENTIVVIDLETGVPEEFTVARQPRIFLRNINKNILLREVEPGDWVSIEHAGDPHAAPLVNITVDRPIKTAGRVKALDLAENRLVMAVEAGADRDDVPLRVPDVTEIIINGTPSSPAGEPWKLRELKPGDRVDVSHVSEVGKRTGRVAVQVTVKRLSEGVGFVEDIDPVRKRLTVRFNLGAASSSIALPIADDCEITLKKADSAEATPIELGDLKIGDRVSFKHDVNFREIIAGRSQEQVTGVVQEVRGDGKQVVVSKSDGTNLTFVPADGCEVTIGAAPAAAGDLRKYDKVEVRYDSADGALSAASIDAVRGGKNDRWAIIIGIENFDDRNLTRTPHGVHNAKLVRETLIKRYAFSEDRVVGMYDRNRAYLESQIHDWLGRANTQTQVVIYVCTQGYVVDNKAYLAAKDSNFDKLSETGLAVEWLLRELEACPSREKLLLLDASHAGNGADLKRQPSTAEMLKTVSVPLKTTAAVASCSESERGLELPEKQRGLFAHLVVEGFGGAADADRDLRITPAEFSQYLDAGAARVPRPSGASQTPVVLVTP
jgi:serine/threonine-protein kinase